MKSSKKWVAVTSIFWAAVFIAALLVFLFCKPFVYRYCYLGDRVTANINVTIDGKQAQIDQTSLKGRFYKEDSKVTSDFNDNGMQISMKASDFGAYTVEFKADGTPVEIGLYHVRCWDVCDYTVNVNIDTSKKTINSSFDYTHIDEDGKQVTTTDNTLSGRNDKKRYKIDLYNI